MGAHLCTDFQEQDYMNDSILQRDHSTVRGTIRYTSKKEGREGQIRGRE